MHNYTRLEIAFTRSVTDFVPFLPPPPDVQLGLLDIAFKVLGGAAIFGLIIIALRRRFERKFRH